MKGRLGATLAFALLVGCGQEAPKASPPSEPSADGGAHPVALPRQPLPPVRHVMQRDPLGNVARTHNLLVDGDFEWSTPWDKQYPWYYRAPGESSYRPPSVVLGAVCRSGIKCVVMAPGSDMFGQAVAANGEEMLVTVWARPDDGDCASIRVTLHSTVPGKPTLSISSNVVPEDDGWCHIRGIVGERHWAQNLHIDSFPPAEAIIDDAAIEPVSATDVRADETVRAEPVHLPALDRRLRAWAKQPIAPLPRGRHPGLVPPERLRRRR